MRRDTVNVSTEAAASVAMSKFTQPLLDTPQTVAVVPQFVLHDEQNTTLRDALRNVPGISMAAGEFGAQGDNLTIRGFTAATIFPGRHPRLRQLLPRQLRL